MTVSRTLLFSMPLAVLRRMLTCFVECLCFGVRLMYFLLVRLGSWVFADNAPEVRSQRGRAPGVGTVTVCRPATWRSSWLWASPAPSLSCAPGCGPAHPGSTLRAWTYAPSPAVWLGIPKGCLRLPSVAGQALASVAGAPGHCCNCW